MQLHRLRLQNFRQHQATDLEFGPGMIGIVGPNGAGKTTLLEALAWAIYGTAAARGGKDSIRRRGAPPKAKVEVELELSIGAHRYRVARSLQHAELYQDGDPAPIANSLAAVTDRLTRILGMSREEFFNTYFTGQKELAIMGSMSAPERSQFLSRVLGYERLRAAQDRLKAARSSLRSRLDGLQHGLGDPLALAAEEAEVEGRLAATAEEQKRAQKAVAAAMALLAEVEPRWRAMERLQETVRSVTSDLVLAEHRAGSARAAFLGLDKDLTEAINAQTKVQELLPEIAPLVGLRAEREALDQQAAAVAHRRQALGQREELKSSLAALDKRRAALPTPDALAAAKGALALALTAQTEASERFAALRDEWVREKQDAQTKRQSLLEQHRDLKAQHQRILQAGAAGACPTCARPLGAEFQNVLDELDRQLQDVNWHGNYFKQRIDQLAKEPAPLTAQEKERARGERMVARLTGDAARLEGQVQEGQALVGDRVGLEERLGALDAVLGGSESQYDEQRHQEVRAQIALLEPKAVIVDRERSAAERAERLVSAAAAAEADLTQREAAVLALQERLTGLGWSDHGYREARVAEQAAQATRRAADLGFARAEAELAAAQAATQSMANRRADHERKNIEIKRVKSELLLNDELDRAFSELRTELNATLRPDLSDVASGFLRDLSLGRYSDLELDEDYRAAIIEDGEVKTVISGGEEDLANLALRLAVSQMIAERAGQPLSLLILDEIFGSLDEDRRIAVLDLLRSLSDRFPQVILITHIDTIREGFDRVIRIGYDVERGVSFALEEPREELTGASA